jgi:hypothetical protein
MAVAVPHAKGIYHPNAFGAGEIAAVFQWSRKSTRKLRHNENHHPNMQDLPGK